jgi:ATP/maltotriose-dependent transcriptional regulator MalT/DNA-binding SARP family transcriptional activator
VELLHENAEKKLIILLGQAAQGKSILAASYAGSSSVPVAWVRLEQEDSEAVNLFYLLVESLQYALRDEDLSRLWHLPASSMGPRPEIALYREWARSLFQTVSTPVRIILDGLDHLSSNAPAYSFIREMIELAPKSVSIIMLSRTTPPIDIQDMVIKQQAKVFTNEDLAFTVEETRDFLKNIKKLQVDPEMVRTIHEATEGWIGGIVLLCESLDRIPESLQQLIASGDLTQRIREHTYRYLSEAIFSSNAPEVRDFLIKSSILEVVAPEFAVDLLGFPDACAVLEELTRKNFFVHSMYDEEKGVVFRYHQLFRGFLKARFKAVLKQEEQSWLLLRAGLLLEERGEIETAIRYYIEAKEYDRAAEAIEKVGVNLIKTGRTDELLLWIKPLPQEMVQKRPWLLLYQSAAMRFKAASENIVPLQDAYSLFEKSNDTRGLLLSMAYLLEAFLLKCHETVPIDLLVEKAEELIRSRGSEKYAWETAVLWDQISFAQVFRMGDLRKAVSACRNVHFIAKSVGDVSLELHSLIIMFASLTLLGEFPAARKTQSKIDRVLAKYELPELDAFYSTYCLHYYLWTGDLQRTKEVLESVCDRVEKHGMTYFYPATLIYGMIYRRCLGEYEEAQTIGMRLIEFSSQMGHFGGHAIGLMELGLSCYWKGDFRKAFDLTEQSIQMFSSDEIRSELHLHYGMIVKNLALVHFSETPLCDLELQETLDFFYDRANHHLLAHAHLAMALLKWKNERIGEAAAHLLSGFKICEARGFDFSILLRRADFARACGLALELQVEGAMDYAAHLLSTSLASCAGPEIARLSGRTGTVKEKAGEIGRLIHRSNVPRLRIRTLGGFQVFRGESLIGEKEWQGRKCKLLLKAIIARGSNGVPREVLLEDLWPEAGSAHSEQSFKVHLHWLRKVLEPRMDKKSGSSYLRLKGNCISLEKDLCEIDVDIFQSLCEQGRRKDREGNGKEAVSAYTKALELYGGVFLPEDLYDPWVREKKDRAKKECLEILGKVADYHENLGSLKKAIEYYRRAIQEDPCFEHAYQKLITLYSRQGKRSAAIKVYEDCTHALRTGLDTRPDEVTTSIYLKTLES